MAFVVIGVEKFFHKLSFVVGCWPGGWHPFFLPTKKVVADNK